MKLEPGVEGRRVTFDEKVESGPPKGPESCGLRTRTFQVQEEEGRLPWQLTGEADIKPGTLECSASTGVDKSQVAVFFEEQLSLHGPVRWNWCYKPQDAMGRDLAMCLEQRFRLVSSSFCLGSGQVRDGEGGLRSQDGAVAFERWGAAGHRGQLPGGLDGDDPPDDAPGRTAGEAWNHRFSAGFESRLGSEMFDLKRTQEHQQARKADREDLQVMGTSGSLPNGAKSIENNCESVAEAAELLREAEPSRHLTSLDSRRPMCRDLKSRIDSVEVGSEVPKGHGGQAESKFTARNLLDVSEKLDEAMFSMDFGLQRALKEL